MKTELQIQFLINCEPHEANGNTDLHEKIKTLEFETEMSDTKDINELMKDVIDHLKDNRDELLRITKTYSSTLQCIVRSYDGDRPLLVFDNNLLKLLVDFNSEVLIDLYIFSK